MPYSVKKNAVFIWIPKTAGTSMINAFRDKGIFARNGKEGLWGRIPDEERSFRQAANWQHISSLQVREELGNETWNKAFKFTFVRNTFDRLVSFYEYSKASRTNPESVQFGLPPIGTFEEWFEAAQPLSQLHYLTDQDGKLMVDFVGRYEILSKDLLHICLKLKTWPIRLKKLNASPRKKYPAYFSLEMRHRVEEIYGEEIERFKYKF